MGRFMAVYGLCCISLYQAGLTFYSTTHKTAINRPHGPHRRDVTHILRKVSCFFLLKSFHFRRLRKRWGFFPIQILGGYKSLYFECYATMPMFADAYISSLGYLWSFFVSHEISLFHVRAPSLLAGKERPSSRERHRLR